MYTAVAFKATSENVAWHGKIIVTIGASGGSGDEDVDVVFLCEYEAGEAHVKSMDEVEQILWLTKEEIMHHEYAPIFLKNSIEKIGDIVSNERL